MPAELGGTLVPLGERVSAIEAKLGYIEQRITNGLKQAEEIGKERDDVARRENTVFQKFAADAQAVLAESLKEYKRGSNEWRASLNDALTKGVQQPEFRAELGQLHSKVQANIDRISRLENKDSEDNALALQLKEREKDAVTQEKEANANRNWKVGIFVTIVTIVINVIFQLWRRGKG